MSFSRAPVKRFNESVGCSPSPGSYDVKPDEVKGAASFHRSDRFRPVGEAAAASPPSPSRSVPMSPMRRTLSVDGFVDGLHVKRQKSGIPMEIKQLRLLEKEIRSLVHQRGQQERRGLGLEEELKKVESRLLAAVVEKTGLSASLTTSQRQLAELKKANEFLKNKVSADATKERINALTMELMDARNQLDAKDEELSFLHIRADGCVKVLETDLQAATTIHTALRESNKDLGDLYQATQTQNEQLENEMDKLHGVILELREEMKFLQGYLDTANDQIQDLRLKLREKTGLEQIMSDSQQERLGQLEGELEPHTAELHSSQRDLKQKEYDGCQLELRACQDTLRETERTLESRELELESSQKTLGETEAQVTRANREVEAYQSTARQQEAEMARLREVLRRTERELDERVAHLGARCSFLEEDRSRIQEEGQRRVEGLKAELSSLQEVKRDERKAQLQLQQAFGALTGAVEKEKAHANSLSVLLEREREESAEQLRTLTDEMEEVLGELSALEEQEQRRLGHLQSMRQENAELGRQLSEAQALLGSKSSDAEALEERHSAAMRKLQNEHTDSLAKIGDLATELESTKQVLTGAEDRQRELELEVKTVQQTQERSSGAEIEHWRKQYDDLFSKVKPFQEQLDRFAAERDTLLDENGANQEELNRVSSAYTRLLGHQNHKQKIKHMVKLKEENVSLKQELSKLCSRTNRQGMELQQLRSELADAPRCSKENEQPETTAALREGNR